ncbi:hypothetical protein PMI42_04890 [Bradyrhizobium sp. YR681]|uniref:hypothetical protein n=1 Tax=Bradyrhizobium sp. YR681 TaxID=1144344 RepID=UPI00027114A7|nr:hypothetical protein [Bradyrhizobium sp. YR681]EJN11875.1 hypothetical protein PMI42_04890 [Bradyrhizobium sp. YR681]
MTSVYNLLREACGISQAEAAEHVHGTRLDTVKSWSSDRRPAPSWAINELQTLSRGIHAAGAKLAEQLLQTPRGNVFVIGLPRDDEEARAFRFPSSAAHHQAIAIAISLLPDDAEIKLTQHVSGSTDTPVLEYQPLRPTATDRKLLMSTAFNPGYVAPAGSNIRKFERLEDLGWIKGYETHDGGTEFHLLPAGEEARAIKPGDLFRLSDESGTERFLKIVGPTKHDRRMFSEKDRFEVLDMWNPTAPTFELGGFQLRPHWTPE